MLRANASILLLVSTVLMAACGGGNADEEAVAETAAPIILGEATLPGTWRTSSPEPGDLATLVLKTDGTYDAVTLANCAHPVCAPTIEKGRYQLYRQGGGTYFLLSERRDLERYQYALRDNVLRLRLAQSREWLTLERSEPAWCQVRQDCMLQNLPPGPCSGFWACPANACEFSCVIPLSE